MYSKHPPNTALKFRLRVGKSSDRLMIRCCSLLALFAPTVLGHGILTIPQGRVYPDPCAFQKFARAHFLH